jgi:hypothetical protein
MSTERTRAALQAWMAAQAIRDPKQMTPLVAENAKVVAFARATAAVSAALAISLLRARSWDQPGW